MSITNRHRWPLLTLLALSAVTSAAGAAGGKDSAEAVPPVTASAEDAAAKPAAASNAGGLTYAVLMKLSPDLRKERIEALSPDDRFEVLSALSGMQRAVLLVDPANCSGWAQVQRRAIATSEVGREGFGASLKEEGQGWLKSTLLGFVPGGRLIEQADNLNELRKYGDKHSEYEDVCEMSPEARGALLNSNGRARDVGTQNQNEAEENASERHGDIMVE